ncbi:MAG: right-handed parallel beta-helix repeat-containing protein [Desulfosporosinus sp.]|nr:right-handed parallel beta-helix repeat-containing protein [Desulfosporosinus sp.]
MKNLWVGIIVLGLLMAVEGAYYWNRQTIHPVVVMAQPAVWSMDNAKTEKPEPAATATATVSATATAPVAANAYYVSTQGDDSNSGTESSPWKTIQKAANSVRPGDTVYIKGGIYNERVTLQSSGSENNDIIFSNYPGEGVTIDGSGIDWGYGWNSLFDLNSKDYIKLIGLRVINSRWAGIGSEPDSNGCENIMIQNCSTYNTESSGIVFFTGRNITLDGNSVEQACTGTSNTQECISLATIATFTITNNHVFNCSNNISRAGGEGIDVKEGSANGTIYNNIVNDVVKVGIYVDAYSQHEYNIEVYGNKVYNTNQGIVVAAEHNGFLENVRINNNVVYNCVDWGFAVGGWNTGYTHAMKDISFINNTAYNIGQGGIYLNNSEAKNVVVVHNTFGVGKLSSYVPIYINGENLTETTIDDNVLNRFANRY